MQNFATMNSKGNKKNEQLKEAVRSFIPDDATTEIS